VESFPIVPVARQVGIAKKNARRIIMCAENRDRLARLHQESLIRFERLQRPDDGVKAFPVARGFSRSAIDHQIFRLLGNFRVEVVHQHAQSRFLLPPFAGQLGSARRAKRAFGQCAFGYCSGKRHTHEWTPQFILTQGCLVYHNGGHCTGVGLRVEMA
jgi:hypothetical protein